MADTLVVRDTERMPRQMSRPPGPDDWTAQRIEFERRAQGISQAELARRVTLAGVPMRQQTVQQIESDERPRRVTIGEAKALAKVLGLTLDQLTEPPSAEEALIADFTAFLTALEAWRTESLELLGERWKSISTRLSEHDDDMPEELRELVERMHGLLTGLPWIQDKS